MKKSKYPVDLGAILCPRHLMWLHRHLLRNGKVEVVADVAGLAVGRHVTSAPMLWVEICHTDRPKIVAELESLIATQTATAAWWNRVQAGEAAALEEHAQRYCAGGHPAHLERRRVQTAAGIFGAKAEEFQRAAQKNQELLEYYRAMPKEVETMVLAWHRRPCKPRKMKLAALEVDVIMVSTRPELDNLEAMDD